MAIVFQIVSKSSDNTKGLLYVREKIDCEMELEEVGQSWWLFVSKVVEKSKRRAIRAKRRLGEKERESTD